MLIVTTNEIPGYRIGYVFGEVFGLTVRSRHIGSNIGAGFKSLAGGELKGISQLLHECRNEALARLAAEAQARGANAVVAFRFETTEYASTGIEVCAYGTAVGIDPIGGPGSPPPGPGPATPGPATPGPTTPQVPTGRSGPFAPGGGPS